MNSRFSSGFKRRQAIGLARRRRFQIISGDTEISRLPECRPSDHYFTFILMVLELLPPGPYTVSTCLVGPGAVIGVSRVHVRARRAVSEVPQPARDDTGRLICKIHHQGSTSRPGYGGKTCLGGSVGRDVARLSTGGCSTGSCQGKRHRVGAGLTIGMGRIPDFTRLAVSKVPEPFCEASDRPVAKMYFQGCFAACRTCSKERCICTDCGSGLPARDGYRLAGRRSPTLQAAKGDRVRSRAQVR